MSQAHSWVQFSQWVQHGCSAVPAAAAQAQVRHKEPFSRKSSTRTRGEGAGSELVAILAQKSTDGNLAATKGNRLAELTPLLKPRLPDKVKLTSEQFIAQWRDRITRQRPRRDTWLMSAVGPKQTCQTRQTRSAFRG